MSGNLSESDCFVLLAKRRRRLAVRVLGESATPLTMEELADRIADREYENPSAADRRTVRLGLHHNHLPRFQDDDVVTYDWDEGTVYPGRNFDTLVRVLDEVNERDMPWTDE